MRMVPSLVLPLVFFGCKSQTETTVVSSANVTSKPVKTYVMIAEPQAITDAEGPIESVGRVPRPSTIPASNPTEPVPIIHEAPLGLEASSDHPTITETGDDALTREEEINDSRESVVAEEIGSIIKSANGEVNDELLAIQDALVQVIQEEQPARPILDNAEVVQAEITASREGDQDVTNASDTKKVIGEELLQPIELQEEVEGIIANIMRVIRNVETIEEEHFGASGDANADSQIDRHNSLENSSIEIASDTAQLNREQPAQSCEESEANNAQVIAEITGNTVMSEQPSAAYSPATATELDGVLSRLLEAESFFNRIRARFADHSSDSTIGNVADDIVEQATEEDFNTLFSLITRAGMSIQRIRGMLPGDQANTDDEN